MVEECVLEKVTPEEMSIYQEQIKLFRNHGYEPQSKLWKQIRELAAGY
jgi:hypothetical protein